MQHYRKAKLGRYWTILVQFCQASAIRNCPARLTPAEGWAQS